MKRKQRRKRMIQTACTAILAVGVMSHTGAIQAEEKMEKCYGISKKGMNDCAANNHSCQGQSEKDGDPTEWIFVPEGTCKKIVNGSTHPKPSS